MTTVIAEGDTTRTASLWEDFVDIFLAPSEVFERRRDGRYLAALAVLSLLLTALTYAFFSTMSAAYDADMARTLAQSGQDVTLPEGMISLSRNLLVFGSLATVPIGVFLTGLLLWLVGRLFGGDLTFELSATIATYATFPRILATLAGIIQGIVLKPDSMFGISTGPARFMDPDTAEPALLTLLARLDLFVIWSVILTMIGLRVIGRIRTPGAWAAAIIVWLIVSLPAVIGVIVAS